MFYTKIFKLTLLAGVALIGLTNAIHAQPTIQSLPPANPANKSLVDSYFTSPTYQEFMRFANQDRFNGYAFQDYYGFWKSWHIVVSRFREDTKEMRVTYANDLAWNTLQKGSYDFPEGAAFGKIGYDTHHDPLFRIVAYRFA